MLKKLSLTASLLLISCASSLPKPPLKEVRIIDLPHQVCAFYSASFDLSTRKFVFSWKSDKDISECDGLIGLDPTTFKKTQYWIENALNDYTCSLKNK